MPRKHQRPCNYPGCSELTGERCCSKHRKEIDSRYDKTSSPETIWKNKNGMKAD